MDCSNNALLYPGGGAALRKVSGSTGNAVSEILVIPNGGYSEIFSGNDCIEWELRFIFAAAATGSVVVEECADGSASAGGETLATVNLVAKLTDRYISGGMRTGYFRVHNSSGQAVTVYIQKRISSADYEVRIGALESSSVDYGNRIDDLEGGGSGSGSEGGSGLSVEAIDALPVAESFHNGDRLIVSKGVEPATLTGTCAGVSSNPNVTIIGTASISVDSGLGPAAFAAAIVAGLNNPTALEQMKASSIDDNGDGTFEVSHYPGVFANSITASGTDDNPSFEVTYPGSSELQQIDESTVIAEVLDAVSEVDIFEGVSAETPPLDAAALVLVSIPNDGLDVSGAGIGAVNTVFTKGADVNSRAGYSNGTYDLKWNIAGFSGWVFQVGGVNKYVSFDDVATPDLVTTWISLTPVVVSGVAGGLGFGVNGTYTPTGILVNGKLKYIKSADYYCYYTGTKWRFFEDQTNNEDVFESTSTGDASPDLATGWVYIGSDSSNTPTVVSGTSLAPVPTVDAQGPTTKTIEWGQLIDTDPTFASDSDLLVPSQKAVNTKITELTPVFVNVSPSSTVEYTDEPITFDDPIPLQDGVWYLVDVWAVPTSGLVEAGSFVGLNIGTDAAYYTPFAEQGPAINWSDRADAGGVLRTGTFLKGPFTSNGGIAGRFFIHGDGYDFALALYSHIEGADVVYPTMNIKVTVTPTR